MGDREIAARSSVLSVSNEPQTGLKKWISRSATLALAIDYEFNPVSAKRQMLADKIDIPTELRAANESLRPTPHDWLAARLSLVWKSTTPTNAMEAKAWLHETGRLLAHLPQDIAAHAIDETVKQSRFTPTVAEIILIAEPILDRRRKEQRRLDAIVNGRSGTKAPTVEWNEHDRCSPEEAVEIMERFGIKPLGSDDKPSRDYSKLRTPASITAKDYINLGLSREDAEAAVAEMRNAADREKMI